MFAPLRVSRDFIDYPYFADLGAIQVAAVLRELGHEIVVVDALAMPDADLVPLADDDVRLGADVPAVLQRANAQEFDAIVVALTPFQRPPARDPLLGAVLAGLREKHGAAPIVLADLYQSGQHVVDADPAAVLAAYPEADRLLRHEAEQTLPLLLSTLLTPRGAATPAGDRVVQGVDPPQLDALAPPAWDAVDLPAYFAFHERVMRRLGRPNWAFPIDGHSLPLVTSRGCPYRCIHCSSNPGTRRHGEQVAPKTQRRYALSTLDREFGRLVALGARRVHLLDELVNVHEAHFDGVLALLERHGLAFEIPNGVRADYLLPHHFALMRGRLTTLSVSAESGSARVLDEIVGKELDLASIRRAADEAARASIPLLVHFMIGLPGETRAEINETLSFAIDLHEQTGAEPSVQFATPLPGTRLEALARKSGARALPLVDDWGPCFQKRPALESESVSAADLRRFKWTFDQRLSASRGPQKVILNATYMCNNRCTFCATGTRTQFHGNFERQRELLLRYRRAGVRMLDIDGGEPTLNPALFALVRFARGIGYEKVNVTTNARRAAYPDYARALVRSGVTTVLSSIHGPDAQTHAQNVGVAEAFDQTCAGIRNLRALAPPTVELGANITITRSNHDKLRATAELILELGLRWFNVQFLTPFGRATSWVAPDIEVAAAEVRRLIDDFGDRMHIQVINLPFCFMPGYERHLMGDMLKLERHMLFVNNDGVNLFEYLRERRVKKPVCEGCPHAVFCGGFYELDKAPEPTWLIDPKDLVRPVDDADLPL